YAEGGRQGAPNAIQVADRFHLSANASAALDEVLRSRRRRVEYAAVVPNADPESGVTPALPPPPISRTKQLELEARARRVGRWEAGCSNIALLFRELEALGYRGSRSLLYRVIVPWRGPRPPPHPLTGRRAHRRQPRPRRVNVRWLCLRPPDQLEEYEREALKNVLADDERIAVGYQLLQRFRRLVVRQCVRDLDDWLVDAAASALSPFMSLARGIQA